VIKTDRNALVNENIGIAYALTRRVARCTSTGNPQKWDETLGAALLALCEAAAKYDPARHPSFSAFAHPVVEHAAIRFGLREKRAYHHKRVTGSTWDETESGDRDQDPRDEVVAESLAPSPEEELDRAEQTKRAKELAAKDGLAGVIMRLVEQSDGHMSQAEMARIAGVRHEEVARVLRELYREVTGQSVQGKRLAAGGGAERSRRWWHALTREQKDRRNAMRRRAREAARGAA
jgi:DNA-directed RNA polymerase specialized sigma subunit